MALLRLRTILPKSGWAATVPLVRLRLPRSETRAMRWDWIALALVAVGMGLRLWLTFQGWPRLDSDEAVIGLMARHILYGGERPVFFYGQHYMGALQAYMAAIAFWFLGATTLALRLAISLLTLGFLVAMYAVGRAAYGRTAGLLTLAFLSFGPAYGLLREQAAVGGYQETLLFGALLPLLVYARLRTPMRPVATRRSRITCYGHYLLMGVVIGLGIWSDELILALVVASLGVLLLARPRELLGLASLALLLGLLIGGFPFIAFNVTHGGQTFADLSQQQLSASGSGLAALVARARLILNQLQATLAMAMPAVLGSPRVCVVPGSLYGGYASYPAQAVILGGGKACALGNSLFSVVVLAIYLLALGGAVMALLASWPRAWRFTRTRWARMLMSGPPQQPTRGSSMRGADAASTYPSAKLWLRVLLVVVAFATIAEFVLTDHSVVSDRFVSARYLMPLYITLPVLFGTLLGWASSLVSTHQAGNAPVRSGDDTTSGGLRAIHLRRVSAWASAALLLILLAFSLLGGAETVATALNGRQYALPAAPADQLLMSKLRSLGISRFYTDYWDCYALAFESGEQLHCSLYQATDRYPPYAALLRATAHPAYLIPLGPDDHAFQRTKASRLSQAGYLRVIFSGYAIYYMPGGQENLQAGLSHPVARLSPVPPAAL